ncbi:MAG TPA: helix-turn-helix domain-containing protein [Solirubrobacteraceae bacterium]
MATRDKPLVPRGRHAPPLEVRLTVQRERLFAAAAAVFARDGYASASAEAIAREAGMSKATFYEHFANKEECLLALFDAAAAVVRDAMEDAPRFARRHGSYEDRVRARITAMLAVIDGFPAHAQTLLVEVIGAGPRATQRRDQVLDEFADFLIADNLRHAPAYGAPVFRTRDDAFAVIGAIAELIGRQLRTGEPPRATGLADVVTRVLLGTLERGAR